jgi:hypothetical protein
MNGQHELLDVIDALGTPGGFARSLNGGEQKGDQDRDDRDHDQQLDQGERTTHPPHGRVLDKSGVQG